MADSPKTPPLDVGPIRDTLKRLSNDLRFQQFIFRGIQINRKRLDLQEKQTRREIAQIKARVRREAEAYPEIVARLIRGQD